MVNLSRTFSQGLLALLLSCGLVGVQGFFSPSSLQMPTGRTRHADSICLNSITAKVSNAIPDPYKVLGLNHGTKDKSVIRQRFRSLVLQLHPDTCSDGGSEESRDAFIQVVAAYRALLDPVSVHSSNAARVRRSAEEWLRDLWGDDWTSNAAYAYTTTSPDTDNHRGSECCCHDASLYGWAPLFQDFLGLQETARQSCNMGSNPAKGSHDGDAATNRERSKDSSRRVGNHLHAQTDQDSHSRIGRRLVENMAHTVMIHGSFSVGRDNTKGAFPGQVVREASCTGYQGLRTMIQCL